MEPTHKKILKAICLELRHLLEGWYDTNDTWHAGDLEQRLAAIGIRRDRDHVPVDELPHLTDDDKHARKVVDAYLEIRRDAGIKLSIAVAEFVRETAYTWANRLLALRCMEARELIDEVILQKEVYGGRSLEHHRLAQRQSELCVGNDDGLFAVLEKAFTERAETLPLLFDPKAPGVALKPTVAALKKCVALLSGTETVNGRNAASVDLFKAADTLGWTYQYWNSEEKDRVFEKVRTKKGSKIEGADIISATQLYTEPYMVKFLVQNSLGSTWVCLRPDTKLTEKWEYFVSNDDHPLVEQKPVREITFLDPACGSGHFLVEAFDLFYSMYEEEGELNDPEEICCLILENNLYGIDIDERAVQIAEAALWMKAAEKVFDFSGIPKNLVATNICLPKQKDHLKTFLKQYPHDKPLRTALEVIFEGLEHADEIGSLLQIEEPVEKELYHIQQRDSLFHQQTDWSAWKRDVILRLNEHFKAEAESANLTQAFFSQSAIKGLSLFDLLTRKYDVVATNPPYMGKRSMGKRILNYFKDTYPTAFGNLFACFINQCLFLTQDKGATAMVTQAVFLYQDDFTDFRKNLVLSRSFITLSDLGPGAFDEIGGENVSVCLFVLSAFRENIATSFIDLRGYKNKDLNLSRAVLENRIEQKQQYIFKKVPRYKFLFWASQKELQLIISSSKLKDFGKPIQGMKTAANNRFLRRRWEIQPNETRWVNYVKGGEFGRFYGNLDWCVDYSDSAQIFYSERGRYRRGYRYYFHEGLTYSSLSGTGFALRYLPPGHIFDQAGSCIFPHDDNHLFVLLAYLNSSTSRALLQTLNPGLSFLINDLQDLPVPDQVLTRTFLKEIGKFLKDVWMAIRVGDPTSDEFESSQIKYDTLQDYVNCVQLKNYCLTTWAALASSKLNKEVAEVIEMHSIFSEKKLRLVYGLTSTPDFPKGIRGLPLRSIIEDICEIKSAENSLLREKVEPFVHDLFVETDSDNSILKNTMFPSDIENTSMIPDDASCYYKQRIAIPPESRIEKMADETGLHPLSIYWLIKEGMEEKGWRCLTEERQITTDFFTVVILKLLGHKWPKQIESYEDIPGLSDIDGIIPMTEGTREMSLVERIRECIGSEFGGGKDGAIEREFIKIMGRPLNQWLETEFFKHHIKQFKKRSIAWQIQSARYTRKTKPAFACLVYYHKIDGDTLPKIRTQYVGSLRQRYETELRGIEVVSIDARSDRQDKRRIELERLISELKEFDSTLQKTTTEAFSSKNLEKLISKEKLDKWCSVDGIMEEPPDKEAFLRQESKYVPNINDGVRVNIAPLQKAGLLASNVLSNKDVDKAIADRAEWRSDERCWCREQRLPQPAWWPVSDQIQKKQEDLTDWNQSLNLLFTKVERWMQKKLPDFKKDRHQVQVDIHEGDLWRYQAPFLVYKKGKKQIELKPEGRKVLGYRGRVDISGIRGPYPIYLTDDNQWVLAEGAEEKTRPLTEDVFDELLQRLLP